MNDCRVARRIASMAWPQKPCTDTVNAQSLATKVFHCSFPFFLLRVSGSAGRYQAGRGRWTDIQRRRSCLSRAGVRLLRGEGTWPSRRVADLACCNPSHHSLIGNEKKEKMSESIW